MPLRVNDIFVQKLSEIQSRVPLRIKSFPQEVPFQEYLGNALNSDTVSGRQGNNWSKDVERAKSSRAASTALIPKDKPALMQMIENNIQLASKKYNVDSSLIRAVIKQESDFDPYSLSNTGAQGLMQLMPETADILHIKDPWDIVQNIDGGTKYLRDQLSTFKGDTKLALAAYNAGPNSVQKYRGIPPFKETQDYVTKVMQYFKQYSSKKGLG